MFGRRRQGRDSARERRRGSYYRSDRAPHRVEQEFNDHVLIEDCLSGELLDLPTEELHKRAVQTAKHHHDIMFFWRLLKYIPEAEAMPGNLDEADYDIQHFSGWLYDYTQRGGKLDDALGPVYIDYLEHHSEPD